MSRQGSGPPGKPQQPRPNAAAAKRDNERYELFQSRLQKLAAAAERAGRTELAETLADIGQQVEDRELTLEEGMAELRAREAEVRAMLQR